MIAAVVAPSGPVGHGPKPQQRLWMHRVIVFSTAKAAYAAMSEIKRLFSAGTWGELRVERDRDEARLLVPNDVWRSARLRELISRYGGSLAS